MWPSYIKAQSMWTFITLKMIIINISDRIYANYTMLWHNGTTQSGQTEATMDYTQLGSTDEQTSDQCQYWDGFLALLSLFRYLFCLISLSLSISVSNLVGFTAERWSGGTLWVRHFRRLHTEAQQMKIIVRLSRAYYMWIIVDLW